jgi:glycosyltransferase involved in cell wall biosynthesis
VKALYVLLEYPVLSQTFITDEIAALRELGNEVMTVSLQGGPGADHALRTRRASSLATLGAVARLLSHRPQAIAAVVRGPLTLGLRLKLAAVADEARRAGVDVVHAHFAYRSADGAEVIGRALGLGHSITVHAHDIFVETTHLRRRLAAARTVVTVCEYNRRHLEAVYGPELAGKLHVVACSTRIDRAPRRAPQHDGCVIVAIGRLVPKKGFDTLVRALPHLTNRARVVLVGDGPEETPLRALAAALGIEDRIEFAGALPHDQAKAQLDDADVFTLPCRVAPDGDRDSMPVVVKEAMAAGVAVVSTNEVGVPEMVTDGVTGLLVDPDDEVALAAALDRLLSDADLRAQMGAAGRRAAEERFDVLDQARRLMEILP